MTTPDGDENQNTICQRCSTHNRVVRKIHIEFRPGSVPPQYGRDLQTCILCDDELRRDLNINLPRPGQVPSRPRSANNNSNTYGGGGRGAGGGRGRGGNTNNNGARVSSAGGNAGGTSCYKCGQPGHFANACLEELNSASRGRGGNAGGNIGGNACYKCGQPGHFANACPADAHNGGRGRGVNTNTGGNTCYKCGQPGHFANACPSR